MDADDDDDDDGGEKADDADEGDLDEVLASQDTTPDGVGDLLKGLDSVSTASAMGWGMMGKMGSLCEVIIRGAWAGEEGCALAISAAVAR